MTMVGGLPRATIGGPRLYTSIEQVPLHGLSDGLCQYLELVLVPVRGSDVGSVGKCLGVLCEELLWLDP